MKCHQCDRPAFVLAGESQIALCLDCWNKLVATTAAQNEMLERQMNYIMDHMDWTIGLPRSGPRFPPRKPVVRVEDTTLNNIRIDRSTIGVLNTGSIETLDVSITSIRETGNKQLAEALQELSTAIAASIEIAAEAKREAIEILSTVSNEATAPREKQKPAAVRVLLGRLGELIKIGGALSALWDRWSPVLLASFP